MDEKKLTPKQRQFCVEYIKDLNATQAAIRAGYSPNCAKEIAAENLTKPNVMAEIKSLQALRADRCQIQADEVLSRTYTLANSNIVPVIDAAWADRLDKLPVEIQKTIKSIRSKRKSGDIEEVSITLHDINKPLELLWRHLGLLQQDSEAIATLSTYGKVTKTPNGFTFEYADSQDP